MKIICLHDRNVIADFARRNPLLHLYELGDLDDFFWPDTLWFGLEDDVGQLCQVALLYSGQSLPVVLAIPEPPLAAMRQLLMHIRRLLPRRFYAHLQSDTVAVFAADYAIEEHGGHWKMGLVEPARLSHVDMANVVPLTAADLPAIMALYRAAYPRNWFTPHMLASGFYYGYRDGSQLASVAGVHTFSQTFEAAALGNVATHPDWRGRGLARRVCARLCLALQAAGIRHIGLNVKVDNAAAIACYERLGFQRVAEYGEYTLEATRASERPGATATGP